MKRRPLTSKLNVNIDSALTTMRTYLRVVWTIALPNPSAPESLREQIA